ncbi:MAG: hypothetical protein SGILL_006651 [Bacillariaceae sp.]
MRDLLYFPAIVRLFRLNKEKYRKLAWIVGKGLDDCLRWYWAPRGWYRGRPDSERREKLGARVLLFQMLHEKYEIGKRFHAIYNAKDDVIVQVSDHNRSFFHLAQAIHADWTQPNNDYCYTLFGSKEHANMEMFHRYQTSDAAISMMNAPFLAHWYKILWQDPHKAAADAEFIHFTKFARNFLDGATLYRLVTNSTDSDPFHFAQDFFESLSPSSRFCQCSMKFDEIRQNLEKYGPLLLYVRGYHEDLHDKHTLSRKGNSGKKPKMTENNHFLVVIGIRKENEDAFLLIQTSREDEELIEMDYEYLRGLRFPSLYYIKGEISNKPLMACKCLEKAGNIRASICPSHLERSAPKKTRHVEQK